ncbi:MAG: type VI secretion system baseplate subunit TssF [Campylobacterota bacterium]|nr:type VI secretion system baseplate subunit TssF [Campylobacterota bacterium]
MSNKAFKYYFQEELSKLHKLAGEFSREHPAIAPLLDATTADPDAQRLLEGVAFLTGLLQQKLDKEFPEVTYTLCNTLFPHYLRPIPALSIVEFTPKPSMREMIDIPAGTQLNATPIDGASCSFSTSTPLEIYPLQITQSQHLLESSKRGKLELDIEMLNTSLSTLKMQKLSFYLNDNYSNASNLFMLLEHYLEYISILLPDKQSFRVDRELLSCDGFDEECSLFPYPSQSFSGYRVLQEYFVLPQKFLFFTLNGLERLYQKSSAKEFKILFHFKPTPLELMPLSHNAIKLFCSPVSNIFDSQAEPILLTHTKEMMLIRPTLRYSKQHKIYDVQRVSSYTQGEHQPKSYSPFESFETRQEEKNIYQVHRKRSIVDNQEEIYLQLHYKEHLPQKKEVLSIDIACTNGSLPERLKLGEISLHSDNSPELTSFKNIIPCTMQIDANIDEHTLWQLISHLSINLMTLADMEAFKQMLTLYMFPHSRDKSRVARNKKKLDAIGSFSIESVDRVSRGYLLKGHRVLIDMRQDYFASLGDLYLFCTIILRFLASYTSINSFVALEVREEITGEVLRWKPLLGDKRLI